MVHQASMIYQANMIHQPLARCCSLSTSRALSLSRSRATSPPKLSCVPQDALNAASHQPISPSLTTVKVRLLICVSACPELSCASGCIECRECTRDYSEGTLASVAPICPALSCRVCSCRLCSSYSSSSLNCGYDQLASNHCTLRRDVTHTRVTSVSELMQLLALPLISTAG